MPLHQAPAQQRPHHRLRPTDHVLFRIGDGLPHAVEDEDDSLSTSSSSWDHLAGFFISAFSHMRAATPERSLVRDPDDIFTGQESDYVSSDSDDDDRALPQPAVRLPLRFPSIDLTDLYNSDSDAEPAPHLPLRFPSIDLSDFYNSDSDAEPGAADHEGPPVVLLQIDDLDAPPDIDFIEPLIVGQDDRVENTSLAAERHEGWDLWHFLWQNTVYTSVKSFAIGSGMAALGGYGTTALASQAPARAVDASIAAVQTFLSMRRMLNRGMNKKKTYAEASWTEISGEIGLASAVALLGGAIAYFNPSSNVFKRISDVVVGTAEAFQPNLAMKFSPTGDATSTLASERGHANFTNILKYSVKRAIKEGAFADVLAAPEGDALKGANPFMMQYIYKNLIDAVVDLCVDVYISLAYKQAAKHFAGIPYQFKDTKIATSDDSFPQQAQKNAAKSGIKAGYKIIGASVGDAFTALPNALGTDVPAVPKNVLGILGAVFSGYIAGEVDAHNARNAAKGDRDNNVDEQHYENQPAPSTSLEMISIQL